jgi:hypothetical protein
MRFEITQEKERLTEVLSSQYAEGLASVEEYERMLEFLNRIETAKEIEYVRKIIETNETYALRKNLPAETGQPAAAPLSPAGSAAAPPVANPPIVLKSALSKKRDVKKIKSVMGNYELRLHDIDFVNNWLTLKLKVVCGDAVIYVPKNTAVENNARMVSSNTIMNNPGTDEVRNKLIITGKIVCGNLYVVYV